MNCYLNTFIYNTSKLRSRWTDYNILVILLHRSLFLATHTHKKPSGLSIYHAISKVWDLQSFNWKKTAKLSSHSRLPAVIMLPGNIPSSSGRSWWNTGEHSLPGIEPTSQMSLNSNFLEYLGWRWAIWPCPLAITASSDIWWGLQSSTWRDTSCPL